MYPLGERQGAPLWVFLGCEIGLKIGLADLSESVSGIFQHLLGVCLGAGWEAEP